MKIIIKPITALICILGSISNADTAEEERTDPSSVIDVKTTTKNGLTVIIFRENGVNFYRLTFKDVIYGRTFYRGRGKDSDLRVHEYDLDSDGNLDAIQIGKDDQDFSAYIVLIEDGRIEVEPLPDNWKVGSEYPHRTFMNFVKKRKGIE